VSVGKAIILADGQTVTRISVCRSKRATPHAVVDPARIADATFVAIGERRMPESTRIIRSFEALTFFRPLKRLIGMTSAQTLIFIQPHIRTKTRGSIDASGRTHPCAD
jgi:hypothetical protein